MRCAVLLGIVVAASCHTAPVPDRPDPAAQPGAASAPAARLPEPPVPALRLDDTLAAVAYRARLVIDPAQTGFHGELAIDATLSKPASLIWLHADRLTIVTATADVNGETIVLEPVPQAETFVGLRAPGNLPAGPLTIRLSYDGVYETDESMGAFTQTVNGTPYVFTQFEALGARRVFPCIDEPSSKVPWTLTLDIPAGQMAIANTAIDHEETMTGVSRVTFLPTRPLPSYLVAFAVGRFETVDAGQTASGKPIRVITFPGETGKAGYAATDSAEIVNILERFFDMPFPYDKLDLVPIPTTTWFGAMENAGMITFRADIMSHDEWTEADRKGWVWYLGHEAAHQWFGDLVTMPWWDDIWLNEAFATWMEDKVLAEFRPAWVEPTTWVQRHDHALAQDGLVSARMIHQPIEEPGDIQNAFDGITYQKGAAVIRMFESWVGADTFRDGVHQYVRDHADGNATSAEFLAAIDAVTDLDVTSAFRTFLDQAGAPRVTAEVQCRQDGPGVVTLTQDRWLPRGSPTPSGAAPSWTFPVCVAYGDGKTRGQACTTMTEATQTIATGEMCPTWILPNADASGYFRVALGHDALAAVLTGGWDQLTDAERMVLAYDVTAMVSRGDVSLGDELDLAGKLMTSTPPKEGIELAAGVAWTAWDVASDTAKPVVAKWIRDTFGKRAAKLGWKTGKDDTLATQDLRATLVPLVALAGDDVKLRGQASAVVKGWPDAKEIDRARAAAMAVRGNVRVRKVLLASMKDPDQRLVRDAVAGLGGIDDPEEAKPVLEMLLDPEVDLSIAMELLWSLANHREVQPVVAQFVRDHYDELRPRIPELSRAYLVYIMTSSCSADDRAPAEAWATDHLASEVGASRATAQALESLDQCVAQRAALQPELDAWVKKRGKKK